MYSKDFSIEGKNIKLLEISMRGINTVWDYYFSGQEDFKPRIMPVGLPFLVVCEEALSDLKKLEENFEMYVGKEAGIADEVFNREDNPILLGFLRGYQRKLETDINICQSLRVPLSCRIVPYQFFLLEKD